MDEEKSELIHNTLLALALALCVVVVGAVAASAPDFAFPGKTYFPFEPAAAAADKGVGSVININTATEAELATLPGMGEKIAKRIVEYRTSGGRFSRVEDIKNVRGIGEKTFENIKDKITVAGSTKRE